MRIKTILLEGFVYSTVLRNLLVRIHTFANVVLHLTNLIRGVDVQYVFDVFWNDYEQEVHDVIDKIDFK